MMTFGATVIGSSMVFLLRNLDNRIEKICLGLASGIMIAASIFSLLIPALETSNCIVVITSFLIGALIIIAFKKINPNKEKKSSFILAVTLHNIPEGMAVGLICALATQPNSAVTVASALALAVGIAIQNIPEGAAISLPLVNRLGKRKAFLYGVMSGIVEPIGGILMAMLITYLHSLLPICLSFAAGTMFYVVVDELIPESKLTNKDAGAVFFMIGFAIMMYLDIILS
jgi:ZIP family zinc transporter